MPNLPQNATTTVTSTGTLAPGVALVWDIKETSSGLIVATSGLMNGWNISPVGGIGSLDLDITVPSGATTSTGNFYQYRFAGSSSNLSGNFDVVTGGDLIMRPVSPASGLVNKPFACQLSGTVGYTLYNSDTTAVRARSTVLGSLGNNNYIVIVAVPVDWEGCLVFDNGATYQAPIPIDTTSIPPTAAEVLAAIEASANVGTSKLAAIATSASTAATQATAVNTNVGTAGAGLINIGDTRLAYLTTTNANVVTLLGRLTSTRSGYLDNLASAPPTAAQVRTEMEGSGTKLALIEAQTSQFTFTSGLVDANTSVTSSGLTTPEHDAIFAAVDILSNFSFDGGGNVNAHADNPTSVDTSDIADATVAAMEASTTGFMLNASQVWLDTFVDNSTGQAVAGLLALAYGTKYTDLTLNKRYIYSTYGNVIATYDMVLDTVVGASVHYYIGETAV